MVVLMDKPLSPACSDVPASPQVLRGSPRCRPAVVRRSFISNFFVKLFKILLYIRTLWEDEPGIMSMRRVGFHTALLAALYVLIFQPEKVSDNVVGALREIMIVVAFVYGAPRVAESITDAVNAINGLRNK